MKKPFIGVIALLIAIMASSATAAVLEVQARDEATNELVNGFEASLEWFHCDPTEEHKYAGENKSVWFKQPKCDYVQYLSISKAGYEKTVYRNPSRRRMNGSDLIEAALTPIGDVQVRENASIFFSGRKNIFFEPYGNPLIDFVLGPVISSQGDCGNVVLEAGWKNQTSKAQISGWHGDSNKFFLRPEQRNSTVRIALIAGEKCENMGIQLKIVRGNLTTIPIDKLDGDVTRVKIDKKKLEAVQRIELTDAITRKYDSIKIKAELCGECLLCNCRALGVFKKTKTGEITVNVSGESSDWVNYFGTLETDSEGGTYAIEFPRPASKDAAVTITGVKSKTRKPKLIRVEETNKSGCVEASFLSGNTRVKADFSLGFLKKLDWTNPDLWEYTSENRKILREIIDNGSANVTEVKSCSTPCEICGLKEGEYNASFSKVNYYNATIAITNDTGVKITVDAKQNASIPPGFCLTGNDCGKKEFCTFKGRCEALKSKFNVLFVPFNWLGSKEDFENKAAGAAKALEDRIPLRACKERFENEIFYQKSFEGDFSASKCIFALPSQGCTDDQAWNATIAVENCIQNSSFPLNKTDIVIALTDSQVCGGLEGWTFTNRKVVFAETINPLIAVHETGHQLGLQEQYCDCSGTESSSHCSSNPADVPNPVSAIQGCDPTTCCSKYSPKTFLGIEYGKESRSNVYGSCNNWCEGNLDEKRGNGLLEGIFPSRTVMSNKYISRDTIEQAMSNNVFYSLNEFEIISKRMRCSD